MNFKLFIPLKLVCLLFTVTTLCSAIDQATPESQGMSSNRLQLISDLAEQSIQEETFPGGVVMILKNGKIVFSETYGNRSPKTEDPYRIDDIFRIASMTKAITTVSIMQLFEDGKLDLDDPIHRYIPAFKNTQVLEKYDDTTDTYSTVPAKSAITIRHCLTHTAGYSYSGYKNIKLHKVYEKHELLQTGLAPPWTTEEFADRLAKTPLAFQPGEAYCYGLNMDILGRVIEIISGKSLAEYFQDRIFAPLQMTDTAFRISKAKHDRIVPIYKKLDGKWVDARETDYKDRGEYPKWEDKGFYAAGGGLSSTAIDYARFCQALINGGILEGKRILSRKSIETMTSDQMVTLNREGKGFSQVPGMTYCLGFSLTTAEAEGDSMRSAGTYEWGGHYCTKFIIDPKEQLIFIGMGQTHAASIWDHWEKMISITYSALN